MDILNKPIVLGIVFLLTLVFGFWLSKVGKPYNGALFNIHKLMALGAEVITPMLTHKMLASSESQTLIVVLIIITGICIVTLFASGAFLSIGNLNYQITKTIHNIALVPMFVAMTLIIYLFAGRAI